MGCYRRDHWRDLLYSTDLLLRRLTQRLACDAPSLARAWSLRTSPPSPCSPKASCNACTSPLSTSDSPSTGPPTRPATPHRPRPILRFRQHWHRSTSRRPPSPSV